MSNINNQWDKLIVYLTDGRIPIDNNPAYAASVIMPDLTFLDRKVAPFLDSCLANLLMELALKGDSPSENQDVTL